MTRTLRLEIRLYLTLVLCALASVATVFGGTASFKVVAIGAFVIAAPGLVLTHLLRIGDSLLSLVIMMMTGPSLWVAIATVAAFSGLWAPATTIVSAAALLALTCVGLLASSFLGGGAVPLDGHQRPFAASPENSGLSRSGRHRSAFPSPYDE